MANPNRNRSLALAAVMLLVGAGLGYGLAKLDGGSSGSDAVSTPAVAIASTVLTIQDSSLTTMGIELETVVAGDLSAEILAPGTVSAAANGQAVVTARAAGTVVRLNKRLGDQVAAGEVLALVASRDAATMAADRATSESKVELARSIVKREQSLYDQKVTPRKDLEAAQAELSAAEAEVARARAAAAAAGLGADGKSLALTSPIAGRITFASAALGAYVEPQTQLFRVADPRFVVVEAAVPAADARRINAGDPAAVATAFGTELAAKVVSVTPTLDAQTRSETVTLALESEQGAPAPGEFVRVRITTRANGASAFVVPDEAVQVVAGRNIVFVRTGQQFRLAPVTVGARSGGRASIVSGLRAGDVIATKNAFLLKAEAGKGAEEEE